MNNLFCQCTAVPVTGKLKQINGIIIELFATSHVLSFLIMLICLSIYLSLHLFHLTFSGKRRGRREALVLGAGSLPVAWAPSPSPQWPPGAAKSRSWPFTPAATLSQALWALAFLSE